MASTNASTSKATTSLNFTSKRLELFFYVADQTTLDLFAVSNCVTIRFGSDNANYYQWTKDKADLIVGWNYINNLTSANGATTGTPVLTACDYSFIQITSVAAGSSWVAEKVVMDDWRLVESADLINTFVSGYPILDETNIQSTVRTLLLTTDANGHDLTEFGLFNTDSTEKMFSRSVFSLIAKTNTTQIIFVQRDKII